ncbi:probable phospholipid-transporting ATPase IA isoform X2 [Sipha flava]|uniref:Probable phospholipid-transporting ATPase IA isoform X2 n=1 Tax=Sipha flava TaxID=143950 RepID=A0A8B8FH78_9HEMI|nr:probable phospholipid-transporting ATPase IA isoform X2 [Sipha flava]
MHHWRMKSQCQNTCPKYSDFHKTYEINHDHCRIIHFNDKEQPKSKSNRVITAKYGVLSFLPLFCIEQFRHFPNQYYTFIAILQQIPDVSPVGRFTTIIPLGFVFFISAIISIIKDVIINIRDHKINFTRVEVLRNGILVQEKWSDIGVGDILKIKKNDIFPADLILLSSSELYGTCYVETFNLDNETNLKIRQCLQETLYCKELQDLINLNGFIECELPNKLLYTFLGRLTLMNNSSIPLDNKQFLHRGSILRNTNWIYGVVIYTGEETKLMLNKTVNSLKKSTMDRFLNSQLKTVFLLIILLSLVCAICNTLWTKKNFKNHWYLELKDADSYTLFLQFISFFIIFHNTIPVSLQVYVRVVRLLQAWFIKNDIDMYHEENNSPAMVKSPNLNFELGKVKYIFSDTTGTLTKNVMQLKHCSIAGELYYEGSRNKIIKNMKNHSRRSYILEFFRILLTCQTVVSERFQYAGGIVNNSISPDELALVTGSQKFGFTCLTRCPNSVTIKTLDLEEHYEILNIIEFTNSRKRMSVIVRTSDSKIKLYCKGADTAIFKCLSKIEEKYKNQTIVHLNNFARAGYRTLCFAYVNISEKFYEKWKEEYLKASCVLINREAAKNKVAEKIERKLKLIGVTAIRNKLQDHVPKTIEALMSAGIKIWLLTGDKQETAINIGLSSRLITQNGPIIIFNKSKLMDLKLAVRKNTHSRDYLFNKNNCTLVINGQLLEHALSNDIKMDFLKLCVNFKSVIVCRISATQKAEFKYLSKLLFVHGASNYKRISMMIYFCYYKSVCFFTLQLWFAMYSAWSGQILFDRWSFCAYNVLYTAIPPLIIGLFLNTYSADKRLKNPQLYMPTKNIFNYKIFWVWIVVAVFHSMFIFWICLLFMKHEVIWTQGIVSDYSVLGNAIYTSSLVIVCLKAELHTQSWSFVVHLTTLISILSWISFIIVNNQLKKILLIFSASIDLSEIILTSSIFWIALIFTTSVIFITDLAAITIKRTLCNNYEIK